MRSSFTQKSYHPGRVSRYASALVNLDASGHCPMNPLGAPASRRPVRSRKPELAGETPALPGTVSWFRVSMREFVRGILFPLRRGAGVGGIVEMRWIGIATGKNKLPLFRASDLFTGARLKRWSPIFLSVEQADSHATCRIMFSPPKGFGVRRAH